MLYMIGLGMWDKRDVSCRALDVIKGCDFVFLESYTSKLGCSREELEDFYGKKIIVADRNLVEKNSDEILEKAVGKKVAFLVAGDVFSATTHSDLYLRAKEKGIEVEILNNASVINSVGVVGLELYRYGRIISIPFPEKSFNPTNYYDFLGENMERGLHTLALLDIKADENRFMKVRDALELVLAITEERKKEGKKVYVDEETFCVGVARLGSPDRVIKAGKVRDIIKEDFGRELHCLIFPGKLHPIEEEMLEQWRLGNEKTG